MVLRESEANEQSTWSLYVNLSVTVSVENIDIKVVSKSSEDPEIYTITWACPVSHDINKLTHCALTSLSFHSKLKLLSSMYEVILLQICTSCMHTFATNEKMLEIRCGTAQTAES